MSAFRTVATASALASALIAAIFLAVWFLWDYVLQAPIVVGAAIIVVSGIALYFLVRSDRQEKRREEEQIEAEQHARASSYFWE
jgi:hypothetical protein